MPIKTEAPNPDLDRDANPDHAEALSPADEALHAAFSARGELLEAETGERISRLEARLEYLVTNYQSGTLTDGPVRFLSVVAETLDDLDAIRRRHAALVAMAGRKPRAVAIYSPMEALRDVAHRAGITDDAVEKSAAGLLAWTRQEAAKAQSNINSKINRFGATDAPFSDAGETMLAELASLYPVRDGWEALAVAIEADPYQAIHAHRAQTEARTAQQKRLNRANANRPPAVQAPARHPGRDLSDPALRAAVESGAPFQIPHETYVNNYTYMYNNRDLFTRGFAAGTVKIGD